MSTAPKVYLIPNFLGEESNSRKVFPNENAEIINTIQHFVVENEKSARRFIKRILPQKIQSDIKIEILNKRTTDEEIPALLEPLKQNLPIGIISEAGMPGIADPGARLVWAAHQNGFQVIPMIGPSSILLALVASGFNGQQFSFHGYLPIDKKIKKNKIKELEHQSKQQGSAEIFMETPFRNNNFLTNLIQTLSNETKLCVACDLTLDSEFVFSGTIAQWKRKKVDIHKRPAIFIIQA